MGVLTVGAWLLALSIYDLRERRLPNLLTLPGAVVILAAAVLAGRGTPAVLGTTALGALYLVVHLIDASALGAGDVKLAIGLGALTGAFGVDVWLLAALGAPLCTAVLALVATLRGARTVPHGPSMCVASAASVALAWW